MCSSELAAVVFWFCLVWLALTFAGYAMLVELAARLWPRPCVRQESHTPPLSVVLVVHNEGARVRSRVENLLSADYPADRLEVVVVSDGSTDDTLAEARAAGGGRVREVVLATRGGKAPGINAGVAAARGEVVVFADARQRFAPDTLRRLASWFADARVGAVSGDLEIAAAASGAGGGVDAYWRLERRIRAAESRLDSCIGCTGAVYAIRRSLFTELPADTWLDDVVIPMRIAVQGHRVQHDVQARAHDPQALEPEREQVRKQRTLAGNFQMLFRYPAWLLPWRNRLWWQLAAHKYARLTAPAALAGALGMAAILAPRHPFYALCLAGQAAAYGLAAVALLKPRWRSRWLAWPAGFVFLNWMTVRGMWYYLRPPKQVGWAAPVLPGGKGG
jgi:cellulose synthase/poly-beta-1,6-N-acetylglucosamine synthase-like glycosyltransferase